jgi:hypothetical protein
MSTPYVAVSTRRMAEKLGFDVHVKTLSTRRPRGWPTKSTKPVQLVRSTDGGHVASFADAYALIRYLQNKAR